MNDTSVFNNFVDNLFSVKKLVIYSKISLLNYIFFSLIKFAPNP